MRDELDYIEYMSRALTDDLEFLLKVITEDEPYTESQLDEIRNMIRDVRG